MAQPFGHENLIVYQKGMRFATWRGALLHELTQRVAACDHLNRGAESILVNTVQGKPARAEMPAERRDKTGD